jgi:hypothetical protein
MGLASKILPGAGQPLGISRVSGVVLLPLSGALLHEPVISHAAEKKANTMASDFFNGRSH